MLSKETKSDSAFLSYDVLDDIALVEPSPLPDEPILSRHVPSDIGPFVELEWLRRGGLPHLPELTKAPRTHRSNAFLSALKSESGCYWSNGSQITGFQTVSWRGGNSDARWTKFKMMLEGAAKTALFPISTAHQIVGAIIEIEDNIHMHSGKPDSGLLGFSAIDRNLQFVVADRGMGVLVSLRQAPEYAELSDSGTALTVALTSGCSRHGTSGGHGTGFDPLLRGLARFNAFLRFRTGDHGLIFDGRHLGLERAVVVQKAHLQGFLVFASLAP